ncbi:MAG: DNA polymerase III subunit delta' [Legionellales bacterium]|nr:DNA polymerase III subunit delta' [Legionellales bacterium]
MNTAIMSMPPWLQPAWQLLQQQYHAQRLPHALLFIGQAGIGKTQLAQQFAHWLLCVEQATHAVACGQCQVCRWVQADTCPDYFIVAPIDVGKAIKVDQIRQLTQGLGQTHHFANGYRVILIQHADSMNQAAANALLKSLEEPYDRTIFLLVADQLWRLPATIISRCQKVPVATPLIEISEPWLMQQINQPAQQVRALLQRAQGAPLMAIRLAENNDDTRQEQWIDALLTRIQQAQFVSFDQKTSPVTHEVFDWLSSGLLDLLRCHWTDTNQPLTYANHRQLLTQLSQQLRMDKILQILQHVLRCKQDYLSGISLNLSLLMDHWLLQLLAARHRS